MKLSNLVLESTNLYKRANDKDTSILNDKRTFKSYGNHEEYDTPYKTLVYKIARMPESLEKDLLIADILMHQSSRQLLINYAGKMTSAIHVLAEKGSVAVTYHPLFKILKNEKGETPYDVIQKLIMPDDFEDRFKADLEQHMRWPKLGPTISEV